MILFILFILSIILCVCLRLLVIVTVIHHIIHWVHTYTHNILGKLSLKLTYLIFGFFVMYYSCVGLADNQFDRTQLILLTEFHFCARNRGNVNKKMWAAMIKRWVRDLEDRRNAEYISSNTLSWWSHWQVDVTAVAYNVSLLCMVGLLTPLTFFGSNIRRFSNRTLY